MTLARHHSTPTLQERVSEFLFHEAELLDERHLTQWLALFDPRAWYRVLPLQRHLTEATPQNSLFIIADDYPRLCERVDSLLSGHSWMETPPSRTRRLLSNVRVKVAEGEQLMIKSNFVVHQFRNQQSWCFVGEAMHLLHDGPQGLRIVQREIRLDHETISAQRRISIIL